MEELPNVDVAVLVKNEVKTIGRALSSIPANNYPRKIRILVCDGNSTDGTQEIIRKYSEKYKNVILHIQKSTGTGAARQELMNLVQAPYVCWTDGGSIVSKNWIRELVLPLIGSDEKVAGSGGYNYVISYGSVLAQAIGLLPLGLHPTIAPAGNNSCFKTEVLRKNPWDITLKYGDDSEINNRLLKKGYRFIINPKAKAYVTTQDTFTGFRNWVKRKSGFIAKYYGFNPNAPYGINKYLSNIKKALLKRTILAALLILSLLLTFSYYIEIFPVIFLTALILPILYTRRKIKLGYLGEPPYKTVYFLYPLVEILHYSLIYTYTKKAFRNLKKQNFR